VTLFTFNLFLDSPDLKAINERLKFIMVTQTQLAAQLTALATQAEKAKAEVTAKLAALQTALDNAGSTTPEVDAALAALTAAVQATDDIVPDVV
jgi:hypothetical protein